MITRQVVNNTSSISRCQNRNHLCSSASKLTVPKRSNGRSIIITRSAPESPEQIEAMKEAMKNPEIAAQLKQAEEAMKNPAVQNEMQEMQQMMMDPKFQQKMAELREDPELKPMFEAVKTGGMPALMKMMNDKTFLSKIGEKMADVIPSDASTTSAIPPTAAATAAGIPTQQQPPEITNILDAAKYGDIEAIEDFVAIGKTDDADDSGRNALHYAVGFNQAEAVQALLDNKMDVNAIDKHGNTALHFAAGYAREDIAILLLKAGGDGRVENSEGDSPLEMIRKEPRNPLNGSEELLKVMEGSVPVSAL